MAIEVNPSQCPECGGKVILTTNHVVYGRAYGKQLVYYCQQCNSYAFTQKIDNEYKAMEMMKNKYRRKLEKEVISMFEERCKSYCFAEEVMPEIKRICISFIKEKTGFEGQKFHFPTMSTSEIIKIKEVLSHYWGYEVEHTVSTLRNTFIKYKMEQEKLNELKRKEELKQLQNENFSDLTSSSDSSDSSGSVTNILSYRDYKEIKNQAEKIMRKKANNRRKKENKEAAEA